MKITKSTSDILKGFFAASVICAHTQVVPDGGGMPFELVKLFLKTLGCLGVPGFFILSGYAFSFNRRNGLDFFWRKVSQLAFPWLFWGLFNQTICYIVEGRSFNIGNVIFGWTGSYYLFSLIIFWIVFWWVRKSVYRDFFCIVSVAFQLGYAIFPETFSFGFSSYFNPAVWVGWFALGMRLPSISLPTINRVATMLAICLIVLLVGCFTATSYWTITFIPFALVELYCIYCLLEVYIARSFSNRYISRIALFGRNSLYILFSNYYPSVVVAKVLTRSMLFPSLLVSPFITMMLLMVPSFLLSKLPASASKKMKTVFAISA